MGGLQQKPQTHFFVIVPQSFQRKGEGAAFDSKAVTSPLPRAGVHSPNPGVASSALQTSLHVNIPTWNPTDAEDHSSPAGWGMRSLVYPSSKPPSPSCFIWMVCRHLSVKCHFWSMKEHLGSVGSQSQAGSPCSPLILWQPLGDHDQRISHCNSLCTLAKTIFYLYTPFIKWTFLSLIFVVGSTLLSLQEHHKYLQGFINLWTLVVTLMVC